MRQNPRLQADPTLRRPRLARPPAYPALRPVAAPRAAAESPLVIPPVCLRVVSALLFLSIGGCITTTPLVLDADQSVILGPDEAAEVVRQCSRSAPEIEATWRPAEEEVAVLESKLSDLRRLEVDSCCWPANRLAEVDAEYVADLYVQYAGVVVNGDSLIYLNAFRSEYVDRGVESTGPPARPVIICDGGPSFWGALYNPRTETFSMLAFNGI